MSQVSLIKSSAVVAVIGLSSLFLTGCSWQSNSSPSAPTTTKPATQPAVDAKKGDTVKTGLISTINGSFYLQEAGGQPKEIESYSVDLSQYVGQQVTVTGQYSGDTLFVGKVE